MKDDCIKLGKAALATCKTDNIEAFRDSDRSVRAMEKVIARANKAVQKELGKMRTALWRATSRQCPELSTQSHPT